MSALLLAEFATAGETLAAAEAAYRAGHPPEDVLSPIPLAGLAKYLKRPGRARIGWVMFAAGATGAGFGYLLQWYSAVLDYPINSGGRPLNSWPAFLLVPYEAAILFAGVIGLLAWMRMCGLPRLFHPLFAFAVSERAVQDRYLLVFVRDEGCAEWLGHHVDPRFIHEADA